MSNQIHQSTLRKRLRNRVRFFNRRYFNPFALNFAGRPNSFWSVIVHFGRHSGKAYLTPIVTAYNNNSFVLPLPYGQRVDWLQNVMSSGKCGLIYQGRVYQASQPEIIPVEEGIGCFSSSVQSLLRRSDNEAFLRLNQACDAPNSPALYQSFTKAFPLLRGQVLLVALVTFVLVIAGLLLRRRRSTV
ncbi:MAG: hypothetical protein M1281_16210 [Chloroflexi bacterium]|nr:hypothetical protein [Chloroflexota bacterium]